MKKNLFVITLFILAAIPAMAQQIDNAPAGTLLQPRQPASSPLVPIVTGTSMTSPGLPATPDSPAQTDVRVSALEDQLRELRGKIEEDQFQIHKLSDTIEKLQRDTDFRFSEISHLTPDDAKAAVPNPEKPKTVEAAAKPAATPAATSAPVGPTTAGDGLLHPPQPDAAAPATPLELYHQAFRLLNETKYEEAAAAFDSFTKKYPKDPLVGNAYYWEGETYYIRRDYVNAADNFRQGFEAVPTGPKAADNLLKLAMSLDAMNRDKEACVVLAQIVTKFKKTSVGVNDKAQAEQKRIGCQ